MAHQNKPYPLRMPDEMREYLQGEADKNNRSLNAEIVVRLQGSIPSDVFIPKESFSRPSSSRFVSKSINYLNENKNIGIKNKSGQLIANIERFKESIDDLAKMLETIKTDFNVDVDANKTKDDKQTNNEKSDGIK